MRMELSVTLTLERSPGPLEQALVELTKRWPVLGQRLHRGLLGLHWRGPPDLDAMLRWEPIEPFQGPPLRARLRGRCLDLRAHHAALDGLAFLRVSQALVGLLLGHTPPLWQDKVPRWRWGQLPAMLRYQLWLEREAGLDRSRRLDPEGRPGSARSVVRSVPRAELWSAAAAWIRALHRWSLERGLVDARPISLELPVAWRRGGQHGNHITPLLLYGDPGSQQLRRELKQQFTSLMRQGAHVAVPFFAAPGAWLPWWVFRRLAVRPAATGFASSHFTWLACPEVPGVMDQHLTTPVCLGMPAGLLGLAHTDRVQLFVSYRESAVSGADAERLADALVQELAVP